MIILWEWSISEKHTVVWMNRRNNHTYIFSTYVLHMAMSVSVLQLTGKLCNKQKPKLTLTPLQIAHFYLILLTYLQMTVVTVSNDNN